MFKKTIYTLLAYAAFYIPYQFLSRGSEFAQKHAALTQFDNNEATPYLIESAGGIQYTTYFLVVGLLYVTWMIWKPKQTQEQPNA